MQAADRAEERYQRYRQSRLFGGGGGRRRALPSTSAPSEGPPQPAWWDFDLKPKQRGSDSYGYSSSPGAAAGGCAWAASQAQAAELEEEGVPPLDFEADSWSRHIVEVGDEAVV